MGRTSIICAAADNWAIGIGGTMPWHISADFKYFKSVTMGHCVIMGRGTWESMGSRPLPGRRNIVVSRSLSEAGLGGAQLAASLEEALKLTEGDEEVFILGGGSLYRQTLSIADRIYLTKVHTVISNADTFFPALGEEWEEISCSGTQHDEKSGLDFEFAVYERTQQK